VFSYELEEKDRLHAYAIFPIICFSSSSDIRFGLVLCSFTRTHRFQDFFFSRPSVPDDAGIEPKTVVNKEAKI
jgi:hypothetical protein